MYDLIIVGGGPAAVASGVYAARKRIKTLLITYDFGGQSMVSLDIQNWIGIVSMSGAELVERLQQHLRAYADDVLEAKEGVRVTKMAELAKTGEANGPRFKVDLDNGTTYETRAIILAAGSRRRKLQVKGAEEFDNKGIVYCASCDAPLFKNKDVVVIGGGNAGLETAEQLMAYAKSIHIFARGPEFKGDKITRERVFASSKMTSHVNAEISAIKGEKFVTGIVWKDKISNDVYELPVQGVFVEIGSIPNSEMVQGLCELNTYGEVVIDHKTARTSVEGIWAAGDITDQPYKQNNISMGDGVKALEDAYLWLQAKQNYEA